MSYRRPTNPNKFKPSRFRAFDGIGGPLTQVLKRTDPVRGWDISNSVANDVRDLAFGKVGEMVLRPGSRKISDIGNSATIHSIFQITIGGVLRYAVKVGTVLNVIDMPMWTNDPQEPITLSPKDTSVALTTVYPAAYPGDPL